MIPVPPGKLKAIGFTIIIIIFIRNALMTVDFLTNKDDKIDEVISV